MVFQVVLVGMAVLGLERSEAGGRNLISLMEGSLGLGCVVRG